MKWLVDEGNGADFERYRQVTEASLSSDPNCPELTGDALRRVQSVFEKRREAGFEERFVSSDGIQHGAATFTIFDEGNANTNRIDHLVFEDGYWLRRCS